MPMFSNDNNNNNIEFESFLKKIKQQGIISMKTQIFSAHQLGSCRMSNNNNDGPTKPNGIIIIILTLTQ